MITHHFIKNFQPGQDPFSNHSFEGLISIALSIAAIFLVVIPDGLPLAISLGVAFQVGKGTSLVRTMDASEKIGGAEEILFSKTGIITKGVGTVRNLFIE